MSAYEWMAFSTCIGTGELMVSCKKTGAFGVVPDPTKEEWSRAYYAPSNPYRWEDDSRVVVKRDCAT
jgi:hypothetical protein